MAVSSSSSPASKPIISSLNKNKKRKKEKTNRIEVQTQSDNAQQQPLPLPCSSPAKRTKSPGVRVIGGRIYDSENGKTCHQCRQKTRDFVASCKNQRGNKLCTIMFCHKCLLNRYGEKAEEMAVLDDWNCPKCRGICNCSVCMKKRGHQPTGILVHTAKATGFSSVSEMLDVKAPDNLDPKKIVIVGASPRKAAASNKDFVAAPTIKCGKENSFDGISDSSLLPKSVTLNGDGKKTRKSKRKELVGNDINDNAFESSRGDGALSEKNSPKKYKISKKIYEKKDMTENDNGVLEKAISEMCNGLLEKASSEMCNDSLSACNEAKMLDGRKNYDSQAKPKPVTEFRRHKKNTTEILNKYSDVDIPLPKGIDLTSVAGIDLPAEDVGHALQFLEFCTAFGQVLRLKKRQPESVLQELTTPKETCRRGGRRGHSYIVQFHIQLLSLIQKDSGEKSPSLSRTSSGNSWLQALGKCISNFPCALKEVPSDCFDRHGDGYDKLDCSKKLRLLNCLCDETLGTVKLRNWIDKQNSKFVEREKEAKEKVLAAKDKEKHMKQKLQDEVAKIILMKNGAPLSISEHEGIVSKIKAEAARAHAEMLEALDMVPKKKQRSDAVRTEPILLDGKGQAYWKLRGYSGEPNMLLQDIRSWDSVTPEEKWFTYDVEQKEEVEKYIASLRKRLRSQILPTALPSRCSEANMKHDPPEDSPPPTNMIEATTKSILELKMVTLILLKAFLKPGFLKMMTLIILKAFLIKPGFLDS
ncbi:hypothetical protein HHK36_006987 [Tetracentron sinense]|uniref:DDT domain-containing protein n=1 Tax=Tetracentron sinense TaxID=13715 RepID=A0A834ZLP5_TETSI|nr:hypothetical protein HHK36_006987 [Tetracentron sinense]